MTLLELMDKVDTAAYTDRVPSPLSLRESGIPVVASETLKDGSILKAYQNGYIMYKRDRHMTVFPLHNCTSYAETDLTGKEHVIHFDTFYDQPWQIRALMEGESRLAHTGNICRSRNVDLSLDAYTEANEYLTDNGKSDPLHLLIDKETTREEYTELHKVLSELTARQLYIMEECVVKQRKHEDVAEELGTSRSNISSILRKSLNKLRRIYGYNSIYGLKRNRFYRKDRFAGERVF